MTGRHRRRSNIVTAVVWISYTAAVAFLIIVTLILLVHSADHA